LEVKIPLVLLVESVFGHGIIPIGYHVCVVPELPSAVAMPDYLDRLLA
jgi:hypothetical protein